MIGILFFKICTADNYNFLWFHDGNTRSSNCLFIPISKMYFCSKILLEIIFWLNYNLLFFCRFEYKMIKICKEFAKDVKRNSIFKTMVLETYKMIIEHIYSICSLTFNLRNIANLSIIYIKIYFLISSNSYFKSL